MLGAAVRFNNILEVPLIDKLISARAPQHHLIGMYGLLVWSVVPTVLVQCIPGGEGVLVYLTACSAEHAVQALNHPVCHPTARAKC
jgi:hypothetical protein